MSLDILHDIKDLLTCSRIESSRIEFKATWDEPTLNQVIKTICAFANDIHNLNGGYIIIGVRECAGCACLPPIGIDDTMVDRIQREIRGGCNRIDPIYHPVISLEEFDSKKLIVLFVPGSDNRPHSAPDGPNRRRFFVRLGSETVDAERNGLRDELYQLAAKVPFDDRRALNASIEDLHVSKVREFLNEIESGLINERNDTELFRKLRISVPVNAHDAPKNVGLLFFSDDPEKWFRGARIEVVQFAGDVSGNVIEERVFKGGLHIQLKEALRYLETFSTAHFEKKPRTPRIKGWVSYPSAALREALVNAVYHRSYDANPEPVKVYLYPNRIEIISYPGPQQGITLLHFQPGGTVPPKPARNRRIGELLKDLRLAEGRGTGIPKLIKAMQENGSDTPRFDFDDDRTYFRVTLPAHPEYIAIAALRDAAHLKALGNNNEAFERINQAWESMPGSPSLATELIRSLGAAGRTDEAISVFERFRGAAMSSFVPFATNVMIDVLLESKNKELAKDLLSELPKYLASNDALDAAILARRLRLNHDAHRYFERAGDLLFTDSRALHEFAQTKIDIANHLSKQRYGGGRTSTTYRRLLSEASELLDRVIQMEADKARHAWAWRDIGRVRDYLKRPLADIEEAYLRAIEILPDVTIFKTELSRIRQRKGLG